ncbi:MAG: hypothetical protein AAF206_18750 [Bacteroidota bacterium]
MKTSSTNLRTLLILLAVIAMTLPFGLWRLMPQADQLSAVSSPMDSIVNVVHQISAPPVNLDSLQAAYEKSCDTLAIMRRSIARNYQAAQTDSARKEILKQASVVLTHQMVHEIFPYWYGTDWDFNGITEKPRQGQIACGYFVSTTLKHAGVKLNRYKVAQQASSVIVEKLCSPHKIFRNFDKMEDWILKQENGLFVVGMDYHVGFIHKFGDELTFVHSSVLGTAKVVQEPARKAYLLTNSSILAIGQLTASEPFIKAWLRQTFVGI